MLAYPLVRRPVFFAGLILLLTACGDGGRNLGPMDGPSDLPVATPDESYVCPAAGDELQVADIDPHLLMDKAELEMWQRRMVELGPRLTGSPALDAWHDQLAHELEVMGLEVQREKVPVTWWDHQEWSLDLLDGDTAEPIELSSYYPYSGFTSEEGVTAEIVDIGKGLPQDFILNDVAGKIVFLEVDLLPLTLALFYGTASYVHDPDLNTTPLTDYTRMSLSILTPQLSILPPEQTTALALAEMQGAVGAVISLQGSRDNVAGQYSPFHAGPGDHQVPAVYVDRETGDALKARLAGKQANLRLIIEESTNEDMTDIIATLPGQSDEVVIVNTHTDGTSASEENGTIGVLSMAKYFSSLPLKCRQRTFVFVLTPGHFQGSIEDTPRFIHNHPEIIARTVGSVTPEHLGQAEWIDDGQRFFPSGLPEPGVFYGSYAPAVQSMMAQAVMAEDLRRVIVSRPIGPIYFGVGSPLNQNGVPNAGYLTGPHTLYSWASNQHLDKMDYERMAAEIRTATRVAATMDGASRTAMCIGMTPPLALGVPSGELGPCYGSVMELVGE